MIFPKTGTQAVHGFAAHGDALFHLSGSKVQTSQILQGATGGGILHALPLTQQAHGRLDGFDGFGLTALLEDGTPQPVQSQSLVQRIVRPLVQQLAIPVFGTGKVPGSHQLAGGTDLLDPAFRIHVRTPEKISSAGLYAQTSGHAGPMLPKRAAGRNRCPLFRLCPAR